LLTTCVHKCNNKNNRYIYMCENASRALVDFGVLNDNLIKSLI
jgi:hypothetical protein